jgi:putative SOS response-associated peptidase YedK
MKWGLIPDWSKDLVHTTINARSETVHEKPTFSNALKFCRCIIPSTGFYEWTEEGGRKQPYFIRLLNSGIMGFAGLWERWQGEGGDILETCCILTTEANSLISPVHDRMPVIIGPDHYDLWLDRGFHAVNEFQRLYAPFPSEMMVAHKVPDLVNNVRFDSHACIVQV